jgi:streptogramin lyase
MKLINKPFVKAKQFKKITYNFVIFCCISLISLFVSAIPVFASTGTITEYMVPTSSSRLRAITNGPDGNLWFTDIRNNNIGRITPSGTITEFPVPTSSSLPNGIATGPDGNLWFTEEGGNNIGRITPSGTITEFPVPTSSSDPKNITAGPDGNLWFTEFSGNNIGRITPGGTITEYSIPTSNSHARGISAGPDGNLWFTEDQGNNIGRITPSGTITEFSVPTVSSQPQGITTGPDGNLWFTESDSGKIGRITPSGTITEYPIATINSFPTAGIISGPDGNLWFTETGGNKIGRITPSGTITEYPVPTAVSDPDGIAVGSDGNLWFTEILGNKIGKVELDVTSKTINNTSANGTIVISTPSGTNITCANSVSEASLAKEDSGYSYPLGLVNLCYNTVNSSDTITITFETSLTSSQVVARDFNASTGNYVNIPGAVITETTYNGQPALQLTYSITDNGPLDSNPVSGAVTDPVGLASIAVKAPNTGAGLVTTNPIKTLLVSTTCLLITISLVYIARRLKRVS